MKFEQKSLDELMEESRKITKDKQEEKQGDAMEEFLKQNYGEEAGSAKAEEKDISEPKKEEPANKTDDQPEIISPTKNEEAPADSFEADVVSGRAGGGRSAGTRGSRSAEAPVHPQNQKERIASNEEAPEVKPEILTAEITPEMKNQKADDYAEKNQEQTPEAGKKSAWEKAGEATNQTVGRMEDKAQKKAAELIARSANWMKNNEVVKLAIGSKTLLEAGVENVRTKIQEKWNGIKEKFRQVKDGLFNRLRKARNKFFDVSYKLSMTALDQLVYQLGEKGALKEAYKAQKKELKAQYKLEKQTKKAENSIIFESNPEKLRKRQEKLEKTKKRVELANDDLQAIRNWRERTRKSMAMSREERLKRREAGFAEAA